MACTRSFYDDCRTIKRLQQATDPGRWMINVPGNGSSPCYMDDTHIMLQKWGANLQTNSVDVDSMLRGVNRTLTRDCRANEYENFEVSSARVSYPTCKKLTVEQSRATNPAWWYREAQQQHPQALFWDPQVNVCLPFQNNIATRLLEKDYACQTGHCPIQLR